MTATTAAPAGKSLASSTRFKAFAIVFSISFPVIYVACEMLSLPLFTYHPATNRIDFGWVRGRSGEGPAMYWYGWVAACLIGSSILGLLATLLPRGAIAKIPLALLWLLPALGFIPLAYGLIPFWTK